MLIILLDDAELPAAQRQAVDPADMLLQTLRRSLAGGRRSAYNWFAVGDESIQRKGDGRIERSEGYGDVVVTVFLGACVGIVAAHIYTVPLLFSVFWERAQLAESDPNLGGIILVSFAYGFFGFIVSGWLVAPFAALMALAARFSSRKYGRRTAAIATAVIGALGGSLIAAAVAGAGIADGPSLHTSLAAYCGGLGFFGGYYYSTLFLWLARPGFR